MEDKSACHHNISSSTDKNFKNVVYTCPMHPETQQEKPGICPECGMNLIKTRAKINQETTKYEQRYIDYASNQHKLNHKKHAGHRTEDFLKKFWFSLILSIPVILYSTNISEKVFGLSLPSFPGSYYLPLVLSSLVLFYGGWVFLKSAVRELKAKTPGMMTLIALAISAGYIYSTYTALAGQGSGFFWELTTLITIMLLGHWFEMKAMIEAQGALKELSKLLPDTAEVIRENQVIVVPLSELKINDLVFIKPGTRIPADGIVIEGQSDVNEAMITGESKPVKKTIGKEVIAGTINGDGSLKVKVTKIGENTFLAGIMRLIAEAQASKSRLQLLSDRAAFYLTLIAIIAGGLSFLTWLILQKDLGFALERLVTVLVIACPHALGLAIPLVISISTTLAVRNGFLIKQRLALESARNINIVLFDKTGTITKGEYGVTQIIENSEEKDKILQLAASIDSHSEHFIAKAIVTEAKNKNLDLLEVKNFQRLPGQGVRAVVDNNEVLVGGESLLDKLNLSLPATFKNKIDEEAKRGRNIIYVITNNDILGALALADLIRPESKEALVELKEMGIKVAMMTGDSEEVAKWVAQDLEIDEYFAKVLPQDKAQKVKLLQEKGFKVAMVGDGINDGPALMQADLGIAIGAGTNVAIESAGIILVRNDPRDIAKIIKLSRLTFKKMIQNLFWATGYNVVAIPLAAGVLASYGILLQPAISAVLMSLSTIIVSFNAILLKKTVI
jgi:Cu2+-exporting ATPase